jgi:hypothetical protein
MFFSHFHPKNTHFSDTSAQKTHVFQPLLPKKCTFFSHYMGDSVLYPGLGWGCLSVTS